MTEIVVERAGHAAVVDARVANVAIVLLDNETRDMDAEAAEAQRARSATLVVIAVLLGVAAIYVVGLCLIL